MFFVLGAHAQWHRIDDHGRAFEDPRRCVVSIRPRFDGTPRSQGCGRLCHFGAPRRHLDRHAQLPKRVDSGARGTTGPDNHGDRIGTQFHATADERIDQTLAVGGMTDQFVPFPHQRVGSTKPLGRGRQAIASPRYGSLMRHRDVQTTKSQGSHGRHRVLTVAARHGKRDVHPIDPEMLKSRIVQSRRQGMFDGVADHAGYGRFSGELPGGAGVCAHG